MSWWFKKQYILVISLSLFVVACILNAILTESAVATRVNDFNNILARDSANRGQLFLTMFGSIADSKWGWLEEGNRAPNAIHGFHRFAFWFLAGIELAAKVIEGADDISRKDVAALNASIGALGMGCLPQWFAFANSLETEGQRASWEADSGVTIHTFSGDTVPAGSAPYAPIWGAEDTGTGISDANLIGTDLLQHAPSAAALQLSREWNSVAVSARRGNQSFLLVAPVFHPNNDSELAPPHMPVNESEHPFRGWIMEALAPCKWTAQVVGSRPLTFVISVLLDEEIDQIDDRDVLLRRDKISQGEVLVGTRVITVASNEESAHDLARKRRHRGHESYVEFSDDGMWVVYDVLSAQEAADVVKKTKEAQTADLPMGPFRPSLFVPQAKQFGVVLGRINNQAWSVLVVAGEDYFNAVYSDPRPLMWGLGIVLILVATVIVAWLLVSVRMQWFENYIASHLRAEHASVLRRGQEAMISYAAHELRNPLQTILGTAFLIQNAANIATKRVAVLSGNPRASDASERLLELGDMLRSALTDLSTVSTSAKSMQSFLDDMGSVGSIEHKLHATLNLADPRVTLTRVAVEAKSSVPIHVFVDRKLAGNVLVADELRIMQVLRRFVMSAMHSLDDRAETGTSKKLKGLLSSASMSSRGATARKTTEGGSGVSSSATRDEDGEGAAKGSSLDDGAKEPSMVHFRFSIGPDGEEADGETETSLPTQGSGGETSKRMRSRGAPRSARSVKPSTAQSPALIFLTATLEMRSMASVRRHAARVSSVADGTRSDPWTSWGVPKISSHPCVGPDAGATSQDVRTLHTSAGSLHATDAAMNVELEVLDASPPPASSAIPLLSAPPTFGTVDLLHPLLPSSWHSVLPQTLVQRAIAADPSLDDSVGEGEDSSPSTPPSSSAAHIEKYGARESSRESGIEMMKKKSSRHAMRRERGDRNEGDGDGDDGDGVGDGVAAGIRSSHSERLSAREPISVPLNIVAEDVVKEAVRLDKAFRAVVGSTLGATRARSGSDIAARLDQAATELDDANMVPMAVFRVIDNGRGFGGDSSNAFFNLMRQIGVFARVHGGSPRATFAKRKQGTKRRAAGLDDDVVLKIGPLTVHKPRSPATQYGRREPSPIDVDSAAEVVADTPTLGSSGHGSKGGDDVSSTRAYGSKQASTSSTTSASAASGTATEQQYNARTLNSALGFMASVRLAHAMRGTISVYSAVLDLEGGGAPEECVVTELAIPVTPSWTSLCAQSDVWETADFLEAAVGNLESLEGEDPMPFEAESHCDKATAISEVVTREGDPGLLRQIQNIVQRTAAQERFASGNGSVGYSDVGSEATSVVSGGTEVDILPVVGEEISSKEESHSAHEDATRVRVSNDDRDEKGVEKDQTSSHSVDSESAQGGGGEEKASAPRDPSSVPKPDDATSQASSVAGTAVEKTMEGTGEQAPIATKAGPRPRKTRTRSRRTRVRRGAGPGSMAGTELSHPLHVLIVDDDVVVRTIVRRIVESFGCTTEELVDGDQVEPLLIDRGMIRDPDGSGAAPAHPSQKFDVIFMDIVMSRTNGADVTRHLVHECGLEIPVVAVTANHAEWDLARFTRDGFMRVAAKPVDSTILKEILCTIADRKGGGDVTNLSTKTDDST